MSDSLISPPIVNNRLADAPVDSQFLDRWSPRALSPEPLEPETVRSLFEAARWAPSAGNEQPWVYVYAVEAEQRARFLEVLDEPNQEWAKNAPMIAFVIARLTFSKNGRPNRTAQFDTGSSWISLALEARKLGLYAHAMAGFNADKAHETLNVPSVGYEVMAAIAIGRYGDPSELSEYNQGRETPSNRKRTGDFVFQGALSSPP